MALAARLNKDPGLSFGKYGILYETAFGLEVSRSGLCQALHQLAEATEPTCEALVEPVRQVQLPLLQRVMKRPRRRG